MKKAPPNSTEKISFTPLTDDQDFCEKQTEDENPTYPD